MIELFYNVSLIFMMAIMGYFLISSPVSETGVRAIEYQGATADDTMETLKMLRGRKAVDDKLRRKDELWSKAVEKAITDHSGSIDKVKAVTESIRKREEELAALSRFARETEELLNDQDQRMTTISQIIMDMSRSAGASYEASCRGYEDLIGELNQASTEISETSESASEVREWFEGS
jgi:methyl-accepting chemotaxis protein